MTSKPRFIAAFAGSLALFAGHARADMATPPPVPPPARVEVLPKPPVTATPIIWQPGHWDWTGAGYVWQPGEYVPQAGHGRFYMPGFWARTTAGWQWQPPHWLAPGQAG